MNDTKSTVVRLSLRWVVAAMIIVLALGILGGMIGVNFYTPQSPLSVPRDVRDQLITTVQQVTVSPSKTAAEIVQNNNRSILTLAHGPETKPVFLSTATVVTNDGVVIARHEAVSGEVFGIDNTGTFIPLDAVGRDAVYGLTFYRIRDGVIAPVELTENNPDIGGSLLLLTRSPLTNLPMAFTASLTGYSLAREADPTGWQQIADISEIQAALGGSPLFTDDGKVAGILVEEGGQRIIPISYLRHSLDRLANGKREFDPFTTYGFTVQPRSRITPNESGIEVVFEVDTTGRESQENLRDGDILKAINDQPVAIETNIVNLLSQPAPLTLTIERNAEQTITVPITALTP